MDRFKSRAQTLRGRQTSAEATLWRVLRGRRLAGWKFRRQHAIASYVVDFVTIAGRLVIEVDGATHGSRIQMKRDAERTAELERLGFFVMRVTNTDVYENLDGVLEAIAAQLSNG